MKTRVISAVVAVILLITIFMIWRLKGLYIICSFCAFVSAFEYTRLAITRFNEQLHIRALFVFLSSLVFAGTAFFADGFVAIGAMALATVFYAVAVLMTIRTTDDLSPSLQLMFAGITGFMYCGVFTGLTTRLLNHENGHIWLFSLLAFVFSGDTGAYLCGRAFGRHKLLEPVSPKKTIEGSFGGLLGSALAGLICGWFFLGQYPLVAVVFMAVVTGGFAQVGDLFESLVKRVADVKDSGGIMPGHGGILDRIDGVLFAAPVFYVLALYLMS